MYGVRDTNIILLPTNKYTIISSGLLHLLERRICTLLIYSYTVVYKHMRNGKLQMVYNVYSHPSTFSLLELLRAAMIFLVPKQAIYSFLVLSLVISSWAYNVMDPTRKWNREERQIIQDCMERWQHPRMDQFPPKPMTDKQSAWFYSLGRGNSTYDGRNDVHDKSREHTESPDRVSPFYPKRNPENE